MRTPTRISLALALTLAANACQAGSFINAKVNPELRTHSQDYGGVGGDTSPIRVCLDIQANQAMALQAEPAILKVIATLNRFRSLGDHNFAFGSATDMPAGKLDFESVLLHEMLHTQGLAHPNLADESALPAPLDQGTSTTPGANNAYEQNPGADGINGSADDVRGDDVNLHWFQRGVNNPGVLPAVVDETTMAHTLNYLPPGDLFAANAGRDVLAALGFVDVEAIAHQGARVDEVQRHLQHDDVTTLRLARAGLDGIQDTPDDYRTSFVYTGRQVDPQGVPCEVAVRFDTTAALATTTTSAFQIVPNHIVIYYARMRVNPEVNWYFSPGPNTQVSIVSHAPNSAAVGQPVTVQASVAKSPDNPIPLNPQGVVEVRDGPRSSPDTAYCSFALAGTANEVGQCTLAPLSSGSKTIVADYLGYGGFDGGSASVVHAVSGSLEFSNVSDGPDPSALAAKVDVQWTLAAPAGPANPTGTVTVKDAADCTSPPSDPANQCTATLPANTCSIRFATAGSKTLRLCYSGDAAFSATSTNEAHVVSAGIATTTTFTTPPPATSGAFQPFSVGVSVNETPNMGGHPAGAVVVRDGPAGDPLTATCSVMLIGTAGESGTCTLLPLRSGAKSISADFAVQGQWLASTATANTSVSSFAIVRHTPSTSYLQQGVSVAVDLDVSPYLGAPAPTGTITVGDGTDQCQIVLPANECLWRGSSLGVHSITATWPGDGNYASRSTAAISQSVVADTYPQLISKGTSAYADSDGDSSVTAFALSADGRYLVFASDAKHLVEGDSNNVADIFVRDLKTSTIRRVSTNGFGDEANGASSNATISANGRYVSFTSAASNLVPGDTNGGIDVFVKDLATGAIVRANLTSSGAQDIGGNAYFGLFSGLSADGRYVVFNTAGTLVASDGNGDEDIYVRDLWTGALDLVSSNDQDQSADFRSAGPSISADGRYVAFTSQAFNLTPTLNVAVNNVYVKDRATRVLTRASASATGEGANNFNGETPVLSADGHAVAFMSFASNLTAGDVNNNYDIFVKNLGTGAIEMVNLTTAGAVIGYAGHTPAISADGHYVIFAQQSYYPAARYDIFRKDMQTHVLIQINVDPAGNPVTLGDSFNPSFSVDGRFVAFQSASTNLVSGDVNAHVDVFVRDLQTNTTVRASTLSTGARSDGDSAEAAVSRDGRYVAFSSAASNLLSGDTGGLRDVFVVDRTTFNVSRASTNTGNAQGNGDSDMVSMSANGTFIVFRSKASSLTAGDSNAIADIFVKDRSTGFTYRVSTPSGGGVMTGSAVASPSVSNDGNLVVFGASDGNLVAGDSNGKLDIFAKNRSTDTTTFVSSSAGGAIGDGDSTQAMLSDDGTRVAFVSAATNFAADDTNGVADIYVKTLAGGAIVRASSTAAGAPGNAASSAPSISADGRFIAFASAASNLVAGDSNGNIDIFVKDLNDASITRVNTSAAGTQGTGGDCGTPSLSSDGRYVGFVCAQTDLLPGDTNALADAFVKDRQTGAITRLSLGATGVQANAASATGARAISDNGLMVFATNADNLAIAAGQRSDIFAQRFLAAPIATTMAITAHTPNPSAVNASYSISVSVTRSSGTLAIGGSLSVGDGDGYCVATLSGAGATASGQCSLTSNHPGLRSLNASYSGDSTYAASAAATVTHSVNGTAVPAAPVIGTASAGNASASVSFTAPSDPGGSPISGYTATCGTHSASGSASPLTVNTLANGVTLTCTVIATNASGNSQPSQPSNAITPAGLPGAPTATSATRGNRQISVAFNPPANNGGSGVLDYTAQCGAVVRSGVASPVVVGPLTNGVAVSCSVVARNRVGSGGASSPANATPATVPDAPTSVVATAAPGQVSVSFSPPSINGGDAITGYTAQCGAANQSAAGSPIVVSGLSNGVTVTCSVVAINSVGTGAASAASSSVTPADVPSAPHLVVASGASGSVLLVFNGSTQDNGSPITTYRGSCTPGNHTANNFTSPITVSGLDNGNAYTCVVVAVNGVGGSAASNSLQVTPRAGVDLSISNSNSTGFVQGGKITSYLIDVTNPSSTSVTGAHVVDVLDTPLSNASWVCNGQNGGICPPSGNGGIDTLVDLPANSMVSFLLSATVAPLPENGVSNTATVTVPGTMSDTNTANNTATDGPDVIYLFRNSFE
jgi:hypothetical protein